MGRTLEIREAGGGDPGSITALLADDELGRERERPEEKPDAAYLEAFEREAFELIEASERNHPIVAEDGGRVVGTLQITYAPPLAHHGGGRTEVEEARRRQPSRRGRWGFLLNGWWRERRRVQPTTDKRRPYALRFHESLGSEATREGMKLHLAF